MKSRRRRKLGFAVATDMPFLEPMRLGFDRSAAVRTRLVTRSWAWRQPGYPADALTDAHIHYLSISSIPGRRMEEQQLQTSRRVRSVDDDCRRLARDQALSDSRPARGVRGAGRPRQDGGCSRRRPISTEEQSMQLNALADAGASLVRARAVREGIEGRSESRRKLEPASRHSR